MLRSNGITSSLSGSQSLDQSKIDLPIFHSSQSRDHLLSLKYKIESKLSQLFPSKRCFPFFPQVVDSQQRLFIQDFYDKLGVYIDHSADECFYEGIRCNSDKEVEQIELIGGS